MNSNGARSGVAVVAVLVASSLAALLTACGHSPTVAPAGDSIRPHAGSPPGYATAETRSPLSHQRAAFDNIDVYKADAARQIVRQNADHTFSGALPPMLPAVVVMRITVDQNGKLTQASVLRSRDEEASKVALASMRRTGYLPMPYNLAHGPAHSLTYMETFLFNADYRFQLRTLAPVQ
ncbi:energy transducer TonB family protein [Massilia sp. PWRC2]|uniref:energy transducer TonB family protein n=1 Tax=Massilia sp. PWRC2 TaxID=2804626 RepID=UPI003CFB5F75